jgi:osmotically-inducible protein OsmY
MADAKRHSKDKLLAIVLWFAVLGAAGPGTALARQGTEDARLETATVRHLRQSTIPGAERVEVEVEDGETELEGELTTLADIWRAVELAERVHGVIEVHSDLDLRGDGRRSEVIERDIQRAFANRPVLMMNDIEVDVRRGGKVVLRGSLQDARSRFAARETVASVRGVTEVVDRLTSPEASDELIERSVREVFRRARHKGFSGQIEPRVEDGVVTLEGVVPRPYERRKATELALGVNGVRRVENRLGVRPDPREIPVIDP